MVSEWLNEASKANNPKVYYYRRKFWTLIQILKRTGTRPNEALNMQWSDVQVEKHLDEVT